MPRLLIVATVPGTIDLFLLPFANHFRRQGWTVDALASEVPPTNARIRDAFDRVHEVRWSRNPFNPSNLVVATREVQRIVRERQYDIVHVHTPVASFITRFALRNRPRRRPQVIYTAHGFHFHAGGGALGNAVFLALERVAARWTDYLVVMNGEDLAAARSHRLVPADRLAFMPGIGVDTAQYSAVPAEPDEGARIRKELGIETGRYALVLGAIAPGKRDADAVSALGALSSRFPDLHLVFAGEGVLEPELRGQARSLGLADKVHLIGFRRDVAALLRSSAALLLPSEREGLPRCLLEAMASGVPCVASDIRGSRDLLTGGCGVLHDTGDVAQLAAALESVLSSPELARELTDRAAEKVKRYDIGSVLALHDELYARALASIRPDADRAA